MYDIYFWMLRLRSRKRGHRHALSNVPLRESRGETQWEIQGRRKSFHGVKSIGRIPWNFQLLRK